MLCLQNGIIPVKITNFKCHDRNKIHCNSFERICLSCVLQSDIEKCFYCHQPLKGNEVEFEIDYEYISNDTFSIYTCPYCHKKKGSHLEITKHVLENHLYHCECSKIMLEKNVQKHLRFCSQCEYCVQCKKNVKFCRHQKLKIKCHKCHSEVPRGDVMQHYMVHAENYKKKIQILKEFVTSERKEYYELLKTMENLYDEMYPDC